MIHADALSSWILPIVFKPTWKKCLIGEGSALWKVLFHNGDRVKQTLQIHVEQTAFPQSALK